TVSAMLSPLQAGSWLMSILGALGAVPSSFTVPLMVATVAGSIGAEVGVAIGCEAVGAFEDCSVFSFLLQAVVSKSPSRQNDAIIPSHVFLQFMMSPF